MVLESFWENQEVRQILSPPPAGRQLSVQANYFFDNPEQYAWIVLWQKKENSVSHIYFVDTSFKW